MEEGKEIILKKNHERIKRDYASVICSIHDDDTHDLAVLKEYLEKVGISMRATRYDVTDILFFSIDKEKYDKVVKRRAGRKKDYHLAEKYKECKVSELREMLKTMKKCEIIKELGCPKRTFYNILKNIEEAEDYIACENERGYDPSIWDYTS